MTRSFRLIGLVAAAVALALVPVGAQAKQGSHPNHSCTPVKKAFVVKGTLVDFTADDAATADTNEASVTLTVTRANRHARRSGELVDNDAATPGTQVTYNASSDAFKVTLSGYDTGQIPDAGDKVRVKGKIAYTKKRCAPEGTSVEDRYGDVDLRRVKLIQTD